MANENVARLKEAYAAWNNTQGGSNKKWMEMMDDHVQFRSLAGGAAGMEFTVDCHNKIDLERYFAGLAADWEMIYYTPEQYIAEGDKVVVISTCSFRNRKTGKLMTTPKADVFTFSNGKVVDFYEFYDTARTIGATMPD